MGVANGLGIQLTEELQGSKLLHLLIRSIPHILRLSAFCVSLRGRWVNADAHNKYCNEKTIPIIMRLSWSVPI